LCTLAVLLPAARTRACPPNPAPLACQAVERLGEEERSQLDYDRRHGALGGALEELWEILEEDPDDVLSRALLARCLLDKCDYDEALSEARRALSDARRLGDEKALAPCIRGLARIRLELGHVPEVLALQAQMGERLETEPDPREAWIFARALIASGRREEGEALLLRGAESVAASGWEEILARGLCQRELGFIERAARTVTQAEKLAFDGDGVEPEILVALGEIYFEAYGEVHETRSLLYSPGELFREALELDPENQGALLGLFRLYRFNWRRTRNTPSEFLGRLLGPRPDCIAGKIAEVSGALDDGDLPTARAGLVRLQDLAPGRRDVIVEKAALAWVEHRRDDAQAWIDELLATDPTDSGPEREIGKHLLELYRFAEGLRFLERSVERDGGDHRAWTELGRAQANTGDEDSARRSLQKAVDLAQGRRNAWRDNTLLVLERMEKVQVDYPTEALTFAWRADAAPIYEVYLEDFYRSAREELSARYGYTPGPARIEVFRRWEDFSVRSTGFQGYPALGVCFGPVVTAVSPLSELRGSFSWARTSYHEFTHVIHLGLSHNRCPRWITEGLATWEEGVKNPAWWRNLRRDLVDARANGRIFAIRRLNAAFRGPRVIFAYYQGGLLCKMMIEKHGFSPMVRMLEAFDRGADLDGVLAEIFDATPEEIDAEFERFVDREIAGLAIEPRWSRGHTLSLRFRLSRRPPEGPPKELRTWADDWCRVARGIHLQGDRVGAEEAMRLAELVGELPPRGLFLRAEFALADEEPGAAKNLFRRGFERGGEDYRARMALAALELSAGDRRKAEEQYLQAQKDFPGFPDSYFSAELRLAELLEEDGELDRANEMRRIWLGYNAGNYPVRIDVAEWLDELGRYEESVELWQEGNEVDPFRRHLHYRWGQAFHALGRFEEAEREFRVGLLVTPELDGDVQQADAEGLSMVDVLDLTEMSEEDLQELSPQELKKRLTEALRARYGENPEAAGGGAWLARYHAEEPLLYGWQALCFIELGRMDEARAALEAALDIDGKCVPALEAEKRLTE
jgi:tetratricopeptide (TPR) repeat protein